MGAGHLVFSGLLIPLIRRKQRQINGAGHYQPTGSQSLADIAFADAWQYFCAACL